MPRTLFGSAADLGAEDATVQDPARVCSECHRAKTIRGVWYLVPDRGPSSFVCEACFATRSSVRAIS